MDETMVLWRGLRTLAQFIKGKRHKFGMKIYILTEPNGLVLKMLIYAGANDKGTSGVGHVSKVVHLMKEKLNPCHSLYMDNLTIVLDKHLNC